MVVRKHAKRLADNSIVFVKYAPAARGRQTETRRHLSPLTYRGY